MGFWETLRKTGKVAGKVAKDVANELEKKSNEAQAMKMRLEDKSSEELKQIIKNEGFFGSSSVEKAVAMKILKERGEC